MKKTVVFLISLLLLTAGLSQAETVTVEHKLGTVEVNQNPARVVVFDYGMLDSLDKLGIEVAGVVKASLPPYLEKFKAAEYVDVGTLFEPNFERIYELRPEVILITTRQAEQFDRLNRIAPTVFLEIDTENYWDSFSANLTVLAEIFNKERQVREHLARLSEKAAALGAKGKESGLNALVVMANDGALSVYGANSRFGVIHQAFGFKPADPRIELANHGQNVSFEYLLGVDPDLMLIIDRAAIAGGSISAKQMMDNQLVKMTSAARNGRIIYLNSQVWYTAAGGITATEMMMEDLEQVFAE
ncbi:MAG TPA: siderophore ABC transporter substrate-binding protein [Firmicutes bacterium]|nr:siderophore ABC transporter substrate-binding protein [Bacillota bacterium]